MQLADAYAGGRSGDPFLSSTPDSADVRLSIPMRIGPTTNESVVRETGTTTTTTTTDNTAEIAASKHIFLKASASLESLQRNPLGTAVRPGIAAAQPTTTPLAPQMQQQQQPQSGVYPREAA